VNLGLATFLASTADQQDGEQRCKERHESCVKRPRGPRSGTD
jgi:hypothetical protein